MFNRMQLSSTLVFVLFFSLSLGPSFCFSQSATVAPWALDEDPRPTTSKSNAAQQSAKATGLQFSDFFLSSAQDFANNKHLNGVLGSLRSALEYHKTEGWTPDKTHRIALKYADALYDNQEYEVCRHVLDSILKSFPDDLEASILRVAVYEKLKWENAQLDEMRTILGIKPDFPSIRKSLALNLVYSQVPFLRNPKEALHWLDPLEKRVGEEPLTFRLMAMAAADTGDFERAMKLQKRYIDSGKFTSKDRSVEEAILAIYRQKMEAPKLPEETIDDKALLSDHALETIARQSMVIVKVRGAVACVESETGQTFPRRIERDHIGTILDTFGTFLVSSETVRLPQFHELLDRKGKGTTQWQSGPFIEVHSLPSNSKPNEAKVSRLIGKAKMLGADQSTGIAVLELERKSEFHFVGIGTVESSPKFEPEFRLYSSEGESKLTENLEVSVNEKDAFQRAELQKYPAAGLKTRVYEDPSMPYPMTAMLYTLHDNQTPIGTPIFNRLGECIGIRHRVVRYQKEVNVAIPAFVCTRVAAKLAANGHVDRMIYPFKIFPTVQIVKTNSGESRNVWGMMAFQDPAIAGFEGLDGKIIGSVDGVRTPTLTQWLTAIERVSSLGLESVALEVFDEKTGLETVMTIPTQKLPTPTPIAPRAGSEPSAVESTSKIDSRAAIEKASQWVANNVDVDREVLDDLIQNFDRMMQNKQNIACYFGSGVVKNGKFHTLLIRDGEVMAIPLTPRSAKLLMLNPKKGAIMPFGEANAKQASAAELSNLKLGYKNVDGEQPFLTINADLRMIQGYAKNISLRVQFVAGQKTPIVVPLEKAPVQDTKKLISLTVPTSVANRSGPIGGLVIIDLVSNEGSVDNPKYRSVSNQVVDYAELMDPENVDMFQMLYEAAEDDEPKL